MIKTNNIGFQANRQEKRRHTQHIADRYLNSILALYQGKNRYEIKLGESIPVDHCFLQKVEKGIRLAEVNPKAWRENVLGSVMDQMTKTGQKFSFLMLPRELLRGFKQYRLQRFDYPVRSIKSAHINPTK